MSGITNGLGHTAYEETDGRKNTDATIRWNTFDIDREKTAAAIGPTADEIADARFGFRKFSIHEVRYARARVLWTGVPDLHDGYKFDDGWLKSNGGAPEMITTLALLTGMMLVTMSGTPQLMADLGSLFFSGLDDAGRELLDLPNKRSRPSLMKVENWQQNANNAFRRFLDVVDPYPVDDRQNSKSYATNKAIWDGLDHDLEASQKARLDTITARFLEMSFYMQPRRLRRATKRKEIDVTFDGTHMRAPLTKGMSHNKDMVAAKIKQEAERAAANKQRPGPVEPFAAFHVEETSKRLDAVPGSGGDAVFVTESTYSWGWNATLARRVFLHEEDRDKAPQLIMAATLGIPGIGTAEAAATLLRNIVEAGHLPGLADADKEYFANALPERLYEPATKLGWKASTDIRDDRLGPDGGHAGAIFVEGHIYCPAMRRALKEASEDFRAGRINQEMYDSLIDARQEWEVRPKAHPDERGNVTMMCPASGSSPRIKCPLKTPAASVSASKLSRLDTVDKTEDGFPIGDDHPEICRQHSVMFTPSDMPPVQQALRYQSKEWRQFHGYARNMVEGANSMAKSPKYGSLGDPLRRQVRGFAAAQIFLTFLLVAINIKQICDFLLAEERAAERLAAGRPAIKKPGQKARDRVYYNPYTGNFPGGAPDLELRQERAKAKQAKADKLKTRSTKKRT